MVNAKKVTHFYHTTKQSVKFIDVSIITNEISAEFCCHGKRLTVLLLTVYEMTLTDSPSFKVPYPLAYSHHT